MSSILIISPEDWDAHTVSKHHYAMTLAVRGEEVFFLNPPIDSLAGITIRQLEGQPNLHVVSAPRVAPGLRFYPALLRRFLERRWLARLEKAACTKFTTIWLFENSRFFDMRFAGNRLKIYHQVDLNQDFRPAEAALRSDISFCTTDLIKERLLPFNPRVYKIHHGVAMVANPSSLTDVQLDRFERKVPHAVYIGNLDMLYLDMDLLANIARQFCDVQFHFVGGYKKDGPLRRLVAGLPNVVWWGKVESALIPAILDRADILLVTYQAARYKDQASPHKFMEYLASGKIIVATYTDEYKDKRHLLEMVDDSEDFNATFKKVINNLDEYNSPEKQAQRVEFAHAHSYDRQVNRIIQLIRENGLF